MAVDREPPLVTLTGRRSLQDGVKRDSGGESGSGELGTDLPPRLHCTESEIHDAVTAQLPRKHKRKRPPPTSMNEE